MRLWRMGQAGPEHFDIVQPNPAIFTGSEGEAIAFLDWLRMTRMSHLPAAGLADTKIGSFKLHQLVFRICWGRDTPRLSAGVSDYKVTRYNRTHRLGHDLATCRPSC